MALAPPNAATLARPHRSPIDLFFCRGARPFEKRRLCSSTWTLRAGLAAFLELAQQGAPPVLDVCMPYTPSGDLQVACSYKCKQSDLSAQLGTFSLMQLTSVWQVGGRRTENKRGNNASRASTWPGPRVLVMPHIKRQPHTTRA